MSVANAATISFYTNDQCSGHAAPPSPPIVLNPGNGPEACRKRDWDKGEKGITVAIDEDKEEEQSHMAIFYADRECNPEYIMNITDGGCTSMHGAMNWQAVEIWDMCNGKKGCTFE